MDDLDKLREQVIKLAEASRKGATMSMELDTAVVDCLEKIVKKVNWLEGRLDAYKTTLQLLIKKEKENGNNESSEGGL